MNAKLHRFAENSANLERATTSATRPVANETSLGNINADAVLARLIMMSFANILTQRQSTDAICDARDVAF